MNKTDILQSIQNEAVDLLLGQIVKSSMDELKKTLSEPELNDLLEGSKAFRKVIYSLLAEHPNNKSLDNLKNILSQISV